VGFYLKRYTTALHIHRRWLLLVLPLLALYLSVAALTEVAYSVAQDFAGYAPDLPVAAAASPIATVKLSKVVAEPDLLFLEGTALTQLQKRLGRPEHRGTAADEDALHRAARYALSLSATGDAGLRLRYSGEDVALGRMLVAFYSDRLMKRITEGAVRARTGAAPPPLEFQPTGGIIVSSERTLWHAERLVPTVVVLVLSSLGVLVLIGLIELSDPSFKSERQIAHYLGVPVLGAIPDAEPLVRSLPE